MVWQIADRGPQEFLGRTWMRLLGGLAIAVWFGCFLAAIAVLALATVPVGPVSRLVV
jgi:hypothetical protein